MTDIKSSKYRNYLYIFFCWVMLLGFIWSRALLSIASIGLAALALFTSDIKVNFKNWLQNRFAVLCLLLFLVQLLSGFWSENKVEWQRDTVTKLAFVAMPLAMLQTTWFNQKNKTILIAGINAIMLSGVCLSLYKILQTGMSVNQDYTLPTTQYNDHIRFGLALVLTLILSSYLLFERLQEKLARGIKVFLIFCSLVFIFYIHYLSARTGLITLYLAVFLMIWFKLWQKTKIGSLGLLAVCAVFVVLAINYVPRLNQKYQFMRYEYDVWMSGNKENAHLLSDNNRLISYELAIMGIKDYLWLGVGSGDINDEMVRMYQQVYPTIPEGHRLNIPHNQFLATALTVGVPFAVILLLLLIAPLLVNKEGKTYLVITTLVLLFALQVEAMLEIQFGIFIYLFYTLIYYKILPNLIVVKKPNK